MISLMAYSVVFSCLFLVSLHCSVEMCAGSLGSGCLLFSKHFYVRSKISLFFVPQTVILEARCLHFSILGNYFGILGAPWAFLGAAGKTRGIQGRIFVDFGMILPRD